ncbi:unnamed protein product [Owenia fusiformis]|uniref:Acylamino-acid-releasing enzyme n=1 Tax=Owenia fusiformis TaxID=6347 RepID=A0A8S4NUS7_OWEFU|nr:unnamed protein product [Owenia fusiformis]
METDKIEEATSNAVDIYKGLACSPSVTRGEISFGDNTSLTTVTSIWSQRDIERSENVKFSRSHYISQENHIEVLARSAPTELKSEVWNVQSPSGKLRVIIRSVKSDKQDEKQYIEIWNTQNKEKNIDVKSLDIHGKIYDQDGHFGTLQWSKSEKFLLYVAEKKQPKTESFFEKKPESNSDSSKDPPLRGEEHVFREMWGEQFVDKCHPVLCVFDIEAATTRVLDTTKVLNTEMDMSAGQAIWTPGDSGVVFVGWTNEPFKLGLIYCPQRRNALYHIDLESTTCTQLSEKDKSVRSPRFTPDGKKLVYLQNATYGPHMTCANLIECDWASKNLTTIVGDCFQGEDGISKFPGIYSLEFPTRCWATDNKTLFMSSTWGSKVDIISINIETKTVAKLNEDAEVGVWTVLDVTRDMILASYANPSTPPYLRLGVLNLKEDATYSITWTQLDTPSRISGIKYKINTHTPTGEKAKDHFSNLKYESILVTPTSESNVKPPLVVYPHGGPHSAIVCDFMLYIAGLCKCGYAVLLVNYRGSTGAGKDSIDSLPGNVGTQDVNDVQGAAEEIIKDGNFDKNRVVVMGGSHGGFLTGHLIGQHPKFYRAAVMRNPAINVASMLGSTDIPDWCFVEAGIEYNQSILAGVEDYKKMWERSPIKYVKDVTTPVMIMLGAIDLRVPPKQGHEYYRALKANNVEARMLVYEGNCHPINKVDAEADAFVNIVKWFTKHLSSP